MVWKTHLVLYFGARGTPATEIVEKVKSLGFEASLGPIDLIYRWGEEKPSTEQVLELADKVADALDGTGCIFNLDTHE